MANKIIIIRQNKINFLTLNINNNHNTKANKFKRMFIKAFQTVIKLCTKLILELIKKTNRQYLPIHTIIIIVN